MKKLQNLKSFANLMKHTNANEKLGALRLPGMPAIDHGRQPTFLVGHLQRGQDAGRRVGGLECVETEGRLQRETAMSEYSRETGFCWSKW